MKYWLYTCFKTSRNENEIDLLFSKGLVFEDLKIWLIEDILDILSGFGGADLDDYRGWIEDMNIIINANNIKDLENYLAFREWLVLEKEV